MGVVMFVGFVLEDSVYSLQVLNNFRICIENIFVGPRGHIISEISLVVYRYDSADFDAICFAGNLIVFTETRCHVNDSGAFAGVYEISREHTKGISSLGEKVEQRRVF